MDKLVCILCRLPYKEPKMCNHCSEIFCTRCITPYLEQNHLCPKCHHILPELADCTRLIAEIKQVTLPSVSTFATPTGNNSKIVNYINFPLSTSAKTATKLFAQTAE